MTETNFTPGPWSLDNNDIRDEAQAVLRGATGCIVADAFTMDRTGECEANARLIATAPRLYGALEAMVDRYAPSYHDCTDDGMPEYEICEARAALAEARSET